MDNGKVPASDGFRNGNVGGTTNAIINVQPPRREDLQPAYALTLQGESENADTHGWYGSMSMSSMLLYYTPILIAHKSTPSELALVLSEQSHVASPVPTPTNQSAKEMLAWSPSSVDSTVQSIQV